MFTCTAFTGCGYAQPACLSGPDACYAPTTEVVVSLPIPVIQALLDEYAEDVLESGVEARPWRARVIDQVLPQVDRGLSGHAHMN
jgi:hypothetical protein